MFEVLPSSSSSLANRPSSVDLQGVQGRPLRAAMLASPTALSLTLVWPLRPDRHLPYPIFASPPPTSVPHLSPPPLRWQRQQLLLQRPPLSQLSAMPKHLRSSQPPSIAPSTIQGQERALPSETTFPRGRRRLHIGGLPLSSRVAMWRSTCWSVRQSRRGQSISKSGAPPKRSPRGQAGWPGSARLRLHLLWARNAQLFAGRLRSPRSPPSWTQGRRQKLLP